MKALTLLISILLCSSLASASEKNVLDYRLKSKISDNILVCELESLIDLSDNKTESKTPAYKFRLERASKNKVTMLPFSGGDENSPFGPGFEFLGMYDIAEYDDEMMLIANSLFGKLVVRYNHIAQNNSVANGESTLSISVMTAGRQQRGSIYSGSGFCKIDTESKPLFPFKDSQVPPSEYSHVKMYYYPELKNQELSMGVSQGGKEVATIVKQLQGSIVKHTNWKQVFTEPETRKYAQALCYIPRHLLVFFDENNAPLSYVEVCLQCKGYRTSDFEAKVDIHEFAKVVAKVGLPISLENISLDDFIKKDRKLIERIEAQNAKE